MPLSVVVHRETHSSVGFNVALTLVDDEDDTGTRALTRKTEGSLIRLHGVDSSHKRRVETVHSGNQVADTHDHV